ncbi:hypothetical protein [Micromonospora globbae]|jgi:hypothetical protein|uniref:Uncharacterized protein n=1 Tax=Micromonospora globbae TaxID=1894969 RepID=A0ABZ1S9V1_9ACTN|nr:hypothetical protein [Micromonospora globbae]
MTIADDMVSLSLSSDADVTKGRAVRLPGPSSRRSAVHELRDLARRGELAAHAAAAEPETRARLAGAAYDIVWPIVFARVTRPIENRRGHWSCASSVRMLTDECLDRHHDDVEAVVTDLLVGAKVPIVDVERWVAARLTAATVDGHRRRRGQRGALQRPRVPVWLAAELGGDPWLTDLAVQILTWVGLPATAGSQLWPLESWARRRESVTGDPAGGDEATVAREVEQVLTAMRRRRKWYADYVERPLGRKWAPVIALAGETVGDPPPLLAVGPAEQDDARLTELASAAVEAISSRLRSGADPVDTVVRVIGVVFGGGTGSEEIDRTPDDLPATDAWVSALLSDPAATRRIVGEVLRIIDEARP